LRSSCLRCPRNRRRGTLSHWLALCAWKIGLVFAAAARRLAVVESHAAVSPPGPMLARHAVQAQKSLEVSPCPTRAGHSDSPVVAEVIS
jgi:hypothetical protein